MKLSDVANELLKAMVKNYYATKKTTFNLDQFKSEHPDMDGTILNDAFRVLESDGFVKTMWADGIAYCVFLLPNAVRSADEDTFIRRGYRLFKEIRSWL